VTVGRVVIGGRKCRSATECEEEGLAVGKRWRIATISSIFHEDAVALARFRNATK
jgi:thiamine monophosphate synthase